MKSVAQQDARIETVDNLIRIAVLGLFCEKPNYSGAVERAFADRFGHLHDKTDRYIRKIAGELADKGLIEPHEFEPGASRQRRYYRATALGARTFRTWRDQLASTSSDEVAHRLAAARGSARLQANIVAQYMRACADALATLPTVDDDDPLDVQVMHEHERRRYEAAVDWATFTVAVLRSASEGS